MNLKKASKSLLLVAVILFIIGTFFDWQIDTILVDKFQFFGNFFQTFGLLPITIVRVSCMLYITRVLLLKNTYLTYLIRLVPVYFAIKYTASGILTVIIMATYSLTGNYTTPLASTALLSYIVAIIIVLLLTYMIFKVERETLLPLLKRVIMVFLITVLINYEVEFIKTHVGRARYYAVVAGLGNYTPWYHINGLTTSNDFMSFISGHTTTAFMAVLPVFFTFPHQEKLRNRIFIFGSSFGILTAFSRMVLSQHYLTDTMGSIIISILTIFILCKLFKVDIDGSDLIAKETD